MGQDGLVSVYFRKQVGSVRRVEWSQFAVSLLCFVHLIPVEVQQAEFQPGINVAGPCFDSFFVGRLGGIPFFLLAKAVTKIEEIARFHGGKSS